MIEEVKYEPLPDGHFEIIVGETSNLAEIGDLIVSENGEPIHTKNGNMVVWEKPLRGIDVVSHMFIGKQLTASSGIIRPGNTLIVQRLRTAPQDIQKRVGDYIASRHR